ncbi:hypothetical protein BOX15_Mlig008335g2 [Macrostomum lignano]|uniref:receptor protein-tyrosine kinase n=2 Tax=Macrostomum lignano TaxID=282301 RepID=A0A267GGC0_9PLAT|nr:hypothetical protein BOX15_Mlig008335g2 [Macrostomum lignano]
MPSRGVFTLLSLYLILIVLEDAGLVAAGSKARHSQRSKPKLKRNEDNWCTSIEHVRSPLSYTLRNESNKIIIECPVRVLPRRSPCRFRVQWYKDGRAIQFDRAGISPSHPHLRLYRRGRHLAFTRVQFYHAGNYTCRISNNEIFPPGPGCHGNQQDPISCYPAKSLKFINLRVSPESHSAIIDSMPYYPPDEPRQLQEGRLYMSRLRDGSEIELHFRDDRQADPFDCRFILAHRRGTPLAGAPRVVWSHSPDPGPSIRPTEFTALGPSSIHGYSIEDPRQVACKPEDFGFAYLSDEWQKSSLMATCYRAGLSALRVSDRSHGYYRCSVSYQNSTLVEQFRLGFSADLSLKAKPQGPLEPAVDFTKNSSVCLGGRLELDCVVSPAAASVVLARVYEPQLDAFGEIVKYNKVDHLLAYWYPKGLESNSSKAASVTVGSRDIRVKLVMDSVTADQDGYYICAAEAKGFRRPALKYFHLDVIPDCVVGEAASRLSAVADAARLQIIVYSAAAGLAASLIIGALIFIYYFAKRRTAPIKKRLVCVDNSELYMTAGGADQRQRQNTASTSQASTVTASDTAQLLVPEVRVERIGASRSMWGFGSRRAGQDDEGEGSTSTKINREVRYVIPSCPVLEVDRKRVQMFRLLGEGAFGSVHSGQLLVGNKPKDVAVKMLKRNYSEEELVALFKEMEIMKLMSRNPHPNIIKLVGISTRNGPFLLLVELAHHGNLRDFLKYRCLSDRVALQYHNLHPGTKQMQYLPCVSGQLLLQFATDVASALDFMASIKIVHRDVAARNILVANGDNNDGSLVAKVADFGLTRNVQDKDYYRVINEGKLPVKWLAPECLRSRVFSTESDVWAYGILLFEIYSFGELPYPGVSPGDILGHLESGKVNSRPKFAGEPMYQLMRQCWSWDPKLRPGFREILNRLEEMRTAGNSLAEPEAADEADSGDGEVGNSQAE